MSSKAKRSKKKAKQVHSQSSGRKVAALVLLILVIGVGTVATPWGRRVATRSVPTFFNPPPPVPPPNQPSKEYIYAGGKLVATEEPAITLLAPSSLIALTVSNQLAPKVSISWNSVSGAAHYEVEKKSNVNPNFTSVSSNVVGLTLEDTNVSAVTAYLYRVRAVDSQGNPSPYSNLDLATAITFTDDSLVSQTTAVKAAHINELRQAVDAIRSLAQLSAQNWGGAVTQSVTTIQATHIQDLRTSLNQALSQLSLAQCSYTDNSLQALRDSIFKKDHIEQLRQCVR